MPVHSAVARNFAEASENKIHSDDIARRFGFTGALVPGVTVFGHLAWPLTQHFGERWMNSSGGFSRSSRCLGQKIFLRTNRMLNCGH